MNGRLRLAHPRRIGWLVVGVALVFGVGGVLAFAGPIERFAAGYSDPGSLPDKLSACGRSYQLSRATPVTGAHATTADGQIHTVVPGIFGLGTACPTDAQGNVLTVLFVRTGDDAYAAYELEGGP